MIRTLPFGLMILLYQKKEKRKWFFLHKMVQILQNPVGTWENGKNRGVPKYTAKTV